MNNTEEKLEPKNGKRWVKCSGCPCLNSDYESGGSCNLGYDTDLHWFDKKGNRVGNTEGRNHLNKDVDLFYASTNCELVEIVTRFKVIKPVLFSKYRVVER